MKHKVKINGSEVVHYEREIEMTDEQLTEWKKFVKFCANHGTIESGDFFNVYDDITHGDNMELEDIEISIDDIDCSELLGE